MLTTTLTYINTGVLLVVCTLFKSYIKIYVDRKAHNKADKEDLRKLTEEVEAVKTTHKQKTYTWRHEYEILKNVWSVSWDLQAHGKNLQPMLDSLPKDEEKKIEVLEARYETFKDTYIKFLDVIVKNRPFIHKDIYDKSDEIRDIANTFKIEFDITYVYKQEPDYDKIYYLNKKLTPLLHDLEQAIRSYIEEYK